MKKMGMILAALVITMFFVGGVAAMNAKNPPDQREKFVEYSAVQGSGQILYEKSVLDKAIAVDVHELMIGDTGLNGSFAMTIHEVLNEGVRLDCHGNCSNMTNITDPIFGDDDRPVMTNFECNKMVQFETQNEEWINSPNVGLSGTTTYNTPAFHGGINAQVTENFGSAVVGEQPLRSLQKDETTTMTTTATYNASDRCVTNWRDCGKYKPYTANELNFDTKNAFNGAWETKSSWKKVCSKNIQHHQKFVGEFQVDKNLIFKEEVTKPCPGKVPREGDC
nr:conserved hypothetical protein, secreted [uncultured archaeon]